MRDKQIKVKTNLFEPHAHTHSFHFFPHAFAYPAQCAGRVEVLMYRYNEK